MRELLILAGLSQLALATGSLAIPSILGWRADTAKLRPLTRQVFWTYAAYICATNLAFGLISTLAPEALLDGSLLARSVAGFVCAYWGARVLVQFALYDRGDAPSGAFFRLAEGVLVALFLGWTLLYGVIAWGAG